MKAIRWAVNSMPKTEDSRLPIMALDEVRKARDFHKSFPQYRPTPLVRLKRMARDLGLMNIYVKDESHRFGLNAFKVLGGSFAMARYIAKTIGKDVSDLPYEVLISDRVHKAFGHATFFTATDGNHGRGVAWAARQLKQKAVVYMPKGSTRARLEHILNEGAVGTIEDANYDECVRRVAEAASQTPNGVVVQDTAWKGYEDIPAWIMQGYGTMAMEADEQMEAYGCRRPTHLFVQAGVGSLAGAVLGYFANRFPGHNPVAAVVEAEAAACLYQGAVAGDGDIRVVDGDMETLMAGLACGAPNIIAWHILKNHADTFVSCPDWVAVKGMRRLAAPLEGDPPIVSGESGAVSLGLLCCIMKMDEYRGLRDHLKLDDRSTVLLFSTEGDTDPDRYRSIVGQGCPSR